jgi:polyhydroxyalkanoate synthase subunit PhaC
MEQPDLAEIQKWADKLRQVSALAIDCPQIQVGQTPKELLWTKNKAKLYRYCPVDGVNRYPVPLLIVYSLINKPYILDLRPGVSLVEKLVGQGYEVYLLDWGNAGLEDRNLDLADYILDYLPKAVKKVRQIANVNEISVLGYCMGATLAVCYTALYPETIKNLAVIAAPIDFSERTLYHLWLDPQYFDLDLLVDSYGVIPPELIDFGNKLLKPYPNFVGSYFNLLENLRDPVAYEAWLYMHKWVQDGVNFAGAAFKQWVRDFYLENKLVKGELYLRGQKVALDQIKANLLNIIAGRDHITLPSQSRPLMHLTGSLDREQQIIPAGHVGLVVGRSTGNLLFQTLNQWLSSRSDE